MKRNRLISITTFALIFFFDIALVSGQNIDNSSNGSSFDKNDFAKTVATLGYIADWNVNDQGAYDDPELYVTTYKIWDRDENKSISEQEWNNGVTYYILDYDKSKDGDFSDWDRDSSNDLDVNEVTAGMKDKNYFKADEADKSVAKQTSDNPTLVVWDTDNDPLIEKVEYGSWSHRFDADDN